MNDLDLIKIVTTPRGIVFVDALNRTVYGSCKAKDLKAQFNKLKEVFR